MELLTFLFYCYFIVFSDNKRGYIDSTSIYSYMSVVDDLSGLISRRGKMHSVYYVVEACFEHTDQIFACFTGPPFSFVEKDFELFFEHTIHSSQLLLFSQ